MLSSDKNVRYIQLGGGMANATKAINGYQFINGVTTVKCSDEDFIKLMRYFGRCYQAKETDGKRKTDSSRPERSVPPLESDVPEGGGSSAGPSDDGSGGNDTSSWSEKPKAKRGRPKRSEAPLNNETSDNGDDNEAS